MFCFVLYEHKIWKKINMNLQKLPSVNNFKTNFSPTKFTNPISNLTFKGKDNTEAAFENTLEYTPNTDTFEKKIV